MAGVSDPTKYKRVADSLRVQIEDGTIAVGEPVPLAGLTVRTQWSRRTCARGLQRLEEEGLLTRYKGLGYFVTAQPGQRNEGQT